MMSKRGTALFVCSILFFLCITAPAYGLTVLEKSLDEILSDAELVFEGKVINVTARKSASCNAIHTYVTFRILDTIKGDCPKDTIVLRFLGGEVKGLQLKVSGMNLPAMDEKGIYFVESVGRHQMNPFLGWSQGHMLVEADARGTERVLSADKRPIVSVDNNAAGWRASRQGRRFSSGIAAGLVPGERGAVADALAATEFKRKLRSRMEVRR